MTSSRNWLIRQTKDIYVQKARQQGFRARSAFKLIEINNKYKIINHGSAVAECGSSPGAWTQVAAKLCNGQGAYSHEVSHSVAGIVVGCDLLDVEPVKGAILFPRSDFTDVRTQKRMIDVMGERRRFDVVISDMAPNASGNKNLDHESIVELSYTAMRFAIINCHPGAHFVTKIWNGSSGNKLVMDAQKFYKYVEMFKPNSSRSESAETYLVAKVFKGIK